MGRALIEAQRPPMWWIEGGRVGSGARFVRFGQQHIAIADITAMSLEEVREPQGAGLFLKSMGFVCFAAFLAYYVFEVGARERFLLGTLFLGALGLAALFEASRQPHLSHFELTFTLTDGRRVVFASADRADIQALALSLATEGAPHLMKRAA